MTILGWRRPGKITQRLHLKQQRKLLLFCFNYFSCEFEVKLGVRGSVRTGRSYPEFCVTAQMRYKIELIFQGGSGVGCARLVYNITPTGAEVKGHPRPLEPRRRRSAPCPLSRVVNQASDPRSRLPAGHESCSSPAGGRSTFS